MSPAARARRGVALGALVGGCEAGPRYGELVLSESHPRARAEAWTFGSSPAVELAPGCPGNLDPSPPGPRVRVAAGEPAVLRATTAAGPVGH
ncbi:MAG: hypothetical protein ACFCGT_26755, partial [Sandaracinaceae bacterium]